MAKIAIVEDDYAISQMYKMQFEKDGFEVGVAENGKLGLAMCEKFRPDILLLDILMPEMNGDEMLKIMRQTEWGKNTKVIILTNVSAQDASANLKNLGVSAYFVKAEMTPRQVTDIVKQQLSS